MHLEAMFVARPKLGVEVTRYLRDALLSGAFAPGDRLGVDQLAAQIGVSTMPVREALVALASEGVVESLPRRGFRVREIRRRDVEDVFRVHAYVAGLLAEAAAAAITAEQLATLRDLQGKIEKAVAEQAPGLERSDDVENLNFEFHRTINHAPDAARLRWFLRAATYYVPRYFYESIPGWLDSTIEDHPAIVSALDRRDDKAAGRLMSEHVYKAGELVLAHLAARGFASEGEPTPNRQTGSRHPL